MFDRVVVAVKRTALEELLVRHHSRGQARFFLERRGTSMDEYDAAHAAYHVSLERVLASIPAEMPRDVIGREMIPTYLFREKDLIIVVGPDGLVANVAKYLAGQPILAVNPDPMRIDGVLVRHTVERIGKTMRRVLAGEYACDDVTLAKAETNDKQTLYAVNDFLIGRRDTISARYVIAFGGREERQSSSGVLVCTGVGSSGWMRSVVTGARAITGGNGQLAVPYPWSARYVLFAVREPFPSKHTGTSIAVGAIQEEDAIRITSEMSEGGVIFSDGIPEDAIEFNAGTIVTVGVAEKSAHLITP